MSFSAIRLFVFGMLIGEALILAPIASAQVELVGGLKTGSSCQQIFKRIFSQSRFPKVNTENSSAQLLDSADAIYRSFQLERADLKNQQLAVFDGTRLKLSSQVPKTLESSRGVIPVEALFVVQASLEAALDASFTLSERSRRSFGAKLHRDLVHLFGIGFTEYKKLLLASGVSKQFVNEVLLDRIVAKQFREAVDELGWAIHVNRDFDIPYLAGYAQDNARMIYIDRSLPKTFQSKSGVSFDAAPYVIVHQGVEKALADFLKLNKQAYHRTHQIAQRLEKAAVEADGLLWSEYQYEIMEPAIEKIYNKALQLVPDDLDLISYVNKQDFHLIEQMKKAFVKFERPITLTRVQKNFKNLAKVSSPHQGVILFDFKDQVDMAKLFLRFQEFFESPKFKGQAFTLAEFETWYIQQKGKFSYYEDWDGFNFPISNLEEFYNGKFDDLSASEQEFLDFLKPLRGNQVYIIAVAKNSVATTKTHELAHALYQVNPQYRAKARALVMAADTTKIREYLLLDAGNYHPDVLDDEVHAWLMNNATDLLDAGVDIAPYQGLIESLKELFQSFIDAS